MHPIKPDANTQAIARLAALIDALAVDWQSTADLIDRVALYPPAYESAKRMLARDCRALAALGFAVERSADHHDPAWRLTGHARFGAAVPSKYCSRCAQWRPLANFVSNTAKASGLSVYCRYCARAQSSTWQRSPAGAAWRRKHSERINARWRARYHRKKNERGS